MKIGNKEFDLMNNCYIMGILNVTPDSFSDGGKNYSLSDAMKAVQKMIQDGADFIDIGGESTRPGFTQISEQEEIDRVLPVIEKVKSEFDVCISLDTYKYKVAAEGIKAGIDIVNDIWGLKYDDGEMARLVAENNIPYILMHNRVNDNYKDFFKDYIADFEESLGIAEDTGIQKEKIILDPGVGFAKSLEQNLEVIRRIDDLKDIFGLPVLLGTSNKSVIGLTLNLPVEERLEGTLSTSVVGVMKGTCILRVHDVRANKRAMDMTKAVLSAS